MSIRPISSVSFNCYNSVSFGSRKNDKKHRSETTYSSTPIKAVPIALLIAMSPISANSSQPKDALINGIEQVQDISSIEQNQKIPFPSNFSYLSKYVVDIPNNEKLGLYFIDSDGNKNNYEYFEYIHLNKDGEVKSRGLLTHVKFIDNNYDLRYVSVYGIGLNKSDLEDYSPRSIMADKLFANSDIYDFLARIIDDPSNNAFERLPKGVTFGGPETRYKYLERYENDLLIK